MGTMIHTATLASYNYDEDNRRKAVEAFRDSLPHPYDELLVGPLPGIANGLETWIFLPDGSKLGWDTNKEAERHRDAFWNLATHMGMDVARVQWGETITTASGPWDDEEADGPELRGGDDETED